MLPPRSGTTTVGRCDPMILSPATRVKIPPAGIKDAGGAAPCAPPSPRSVGRPSVHDGIGHDVLHRIHRLVVHPYLIVQVRSRGEPGRADLRDHLPTLHALAAHDEIGRAHV